MQKIKNYSHPNLDKQTLGKYYRRNRAVNREFHRERNEKKLRAIKVVYWHEVLHPTVPIRQYTK